jgi:hypothetical protein
MAYDMILDQPGWSELLTFCGLGHDPKRWLMPGVEARTGCFKLSGTRFHLCGVFSTYRYVRAIWISRPKPPPQAKVCGVSMKLGLCRAAVGTLEIVDCMVSPTWM